jgi:SRSO17 transposase
MAGEGVEPVEVSVGVPAVRSVTVADLEGVVEELKAYHAEFAPVFQRSEQRRWAGVYLEGLLTAEVPRKNVEAMALRRYGAGAEASGRVRSMQQFIGASRWDDRAILAKHRQLVDETLGEEDGVFILDGSDFPKKGEHSAGVARQWCGATGKKDNCQAGVFLGYASGKGYTLLDRRLYLPESWFAEDHRELWRKARIPEGTPFRSKHELAAELVEEAMQGGELRGRWIACDEGYGDAPALLDRIAATGLWYLAEVPKTTKVWPLVEADGSTQREGPQVWLPERKLSHKGPAPVRVRLVPGSATRVQLDEWAEQVPAAARRRFRMLEGSKGPLVADFVAFRAVAGRGKLPGPEVWVLLRYKVTGEEELPKVKYYLSNAPADTTIEELVRVCGMRWPIESCFEEAKGELGMDQYELRFWAGWHHHMTLVILAHHFLVRLQQRLSQREGGHEPGNKATNSLDHIAHSGRGKQLPGTATSA